MKLDTAVLFKYNVKLLVQRLKKLNKYSGFSKRDCSLSAKLCKTWRIPQFKQLLVIIEISKY